LRLANALSALYPKESEEKRLLDAMLLARAAIGGYSWNFQDIVNIRTRRAVHSPDVSRREGEKVVAVKKFQDKFSGFPLKVVYEKIGNELFIITAYPIKKKMWR
jgi:hypothetical protein